VFIDEKGEKRVWANHNYYDRIAPYGTGTDEKSKTIPFAETGDWFSYRVTVPVPGNMVKRRIKKMREKKAYMIFFSYLRRCCN
jgi:hypothetical protein